MYMRRCYPCITACLVMMFLVAGCSDSSQALRADHLHYPQIKDRQRSIVFPSRQVRWTSAQASVIGRDSQPWYAGRNDEQVAVYSGEQSATSEITSTFVYERLHQNGSRVRDNVRVQTYRSSVTESIR